MTTAIIDIIRELRATKGSKAKAAILETHKARQDLQRFIHFTYEPTISFFISPNNKLPAKMNGECSGMVECETLYSTLASRKVTGHAAKNFYELTMALCTPDGAELINIMLDRDLRCGVGEGTINKTWPGLITEVPYMRCALPETAKIKKWDWGKPGFYALSQPKADGMFANATVTGNKVVFASRNGQTFTHGKHFDKAAQTLKDMWSISSGPDFQLHGEFLVKKDGKILPRELGNGIMNSLLKDGELEAGVELLYVFWDYVPLEHVAKKRYEVPYETRFAVACAMLDTVRNLTATLGEPVVDDSLAIKYLVSRKVYSYAEATEHFIELTMAGEEGTVCKKATMPWFDGDSMEQVKMKITFAVELRIKGFNAGNESGRHSLTFGSLQCESEDGQLAVGVSGMSDKLRKEISDNRDAYLDAIVTVSSNNVTAPSKSNNLYSMFLPRLEEFRHDKKEADSIGRILAQFEAAKRGEQLVAAAIAPEVVPA